MKGVFTARLVAFALTLLCAETPLLQTGACVAKAAGEAERVTITSFSGTVQFASNGWQASAGVGNASDSEKSYILNAPELYIESPEIDFSAYTDLEITIGARTYSGPTETQGVISLLVGESIIATVLPTTNVAAKYAVTLSQQPAGQGRLRLQCLAAAKTSGSAVSAVTVTGIPLVSGAWARFSAASVTYTPGVAFTPPTFSTNSPAR